MVEISAATSAAVSLGSIISIILAGLWIWKLTAKANRKTYDLPTPPGSFGLPLLGETLQVLYSLKTKPWEFFEAREKKYGPIFKTHVFGHPTVVVSPPLGFKFLFSNHGRLLESAWPPPMRMAMGDKSLFFMEGHKAKSFRQILMAFLGPEGMRRYVGKSSLLIQEHIDKFWLDGSEVRAYYRVKKVLFSIVFRLFLSIQDEEQENELLHPFLVFLQGVLELPIDLPGTKFYRAKVAKRKIFEKLDKFIGTRRVELQEGTTAEQDLLSVLLTTRGEDGELMTDEEIKQNILMLVMAGHDTTSSALAVSMKVIAEHRWCYDQLRQEHLAVAAAKDPNEPLSLNDLQKMNYTWRVVQEAMRLVPPAVGTMRRAVCDITIEGFTVPKDWRFMWSPVQTNRKAAFFDNPDRFDPQRFDPSQATLIPYTYAPFGGGPRICPGLELSKMLVRVFLHHLITKFRWTLLDPHESIKLFPLAAPVRGLPIKLTKVES